MTTKIEWTDETWNPTTGCTKVSEGCRHCYIDRTPPFRIKHISFDKGEEIGATTGVTLHPDRLDQPLRWTKSRRIFVNSLSDLFHEDIPDVFISDVFCRMAAAKQHTFQVLTKRPRRMMNLLRSGEFHASMIRALDVAYNDFAYEWPLPNVWLGTSVEDQKAADLRIPLLLETPAAIRFLSCEPLLGPVDLSKWLHLGIQERWTEPVNALEGTPTETVRFRCSCGLVGKPTDDETMAESEWQIHRDYAASLDWVIAGGESGPKARPMHPDWARSLRDQCVAAGVPFFFKQWGEWVAPPKEIQSDLSWVPWSYGTPEMQREANKAVSLDGVPMFRVGKKKAGRELDGRAWDEFPEVAV